MGARRALGAVLLVGGLGMALVGVAGTFASGGGSAVASPAPSVGLTAEPPVTAPPASEAPSGLSTPSPTAAPPTVAPTQDTLTAVRAFFDRLQAAIRAGSQGDILDDLGAAVIERYGRPACAAYLTSRPPEPERNFEILAVSGAAPWDYLTDGLTTTVPDTLTVQARVTAPDSSGVATTVERELHVQLTGDRLYWFTDCGTPLP